MRLSVLILLASARVASAYPIFQFASGSDHCEACHFAPDGGGLLNDFGRSEAGDTISWRGDGRFLHGAWTPPAAIALGGDFRFAGAGVARTEESQLLAFPMQADAYGQFQFDRFRIGGSLGASKVHAGTVYSQAAQITKNNNDGDYNLISRSHWIGYDFSDHVLLRAGRLNLPFGVRIPEHVMWVRTATNTDREHSQEHGVALDYSEGRIRGEIMGIAGNFQISPDKFRSRGYSLYGEYLLSPHAAVGLSSLVTHAEADYTIAQSPTNTRQAHGLTGRVAPITPLVFLAEGDLLLSSVASAGYVGMLQADYEMIQGLHLMGTGEIQDTGKPNGTSTSAPGSGEPQFGGWLTVNWFFFTHFDVRVDLVVRQNNATALQSQFHFYF